MNNIYDQHDCNCDHCRNELNLDKLCVKKIIACKIRTKKLTVEDEFCAPLLSAPEACVGLIMAKKLEADDACITNLTTTTIGTSNITANEGCVPGILKVGNLLNCGKYRAAVSYSTLTTYTLGTDISFDTILDDPNSNIGFSPTSYTVPVSGYYSVTLQVNAQNLVTTGPVLGVPTANPQVYVNGVLHNEIFSSYLAFYAQQKTSLSAIILLKSGDIVTMKYNVLALDSGTGVVFLSGTVDSIGNGTDFNTSGFKIHMLSVDCPSMPCDPSIGCTPRQCEPCIPCPSTTGQCDSGKCS